MRYLRTDHGDGAGTTAPTCPECEQGKHRNCDGTAWNNHADDVDACACERNHHNGATS
jgi:hypothetical protein